MLFQTSTLKTDFAAVHKLIYSYPKTGKTTFAAQMRNPTGHVPFFVMTEDGLGSLQVRSQRVTNWDGFKRMIAHLENNKTTLAAECSTLVVDVLNDLDTWAARHVAEHKRVEHVSDLEHGKGWHLLRHTIVDELGRLMALAPVTFVCHTTEKETKLNGEPIKCNAPSLSKACLEYVNGKVDAIIWIEPASSKSRLAKLVMRPTGRAIAGARQRAIAKEYPYDHEHPGDAYQRICADYAAAQTALINAGATTPPNQEQT